MALHRIAWNGLWNANCSVLGRVVVPRKVSDYNAQRRVLSTDREKEALKGLSVEEILALPSNRATRYVYLRTIPLAAQSEYSNPSGNDNTMVGEAVSAIESQTSRVIAKHAGSKVVDLRSAVHLHTAALALSTYRVCAPTVGTERSVGLIRKAFGIGQSLPAHWITKTALLFTPNRLNAARRMMDNTVQDFGEAFDARVVEADTDEDTVQLVINKCFYKKLFAEEDAAHLTKLFCEMDAALFKPISKKAHGLEFALESTLMDEEAERCNFVITRNSRAKARASSSPQ